MPGTDRRCRNTGWRSRPASCGRATSTSSPGRPIGTGYILALFGFVANQPQTETALLGIRLMFSPVPAGLSLVGATAIVFYRLDRRQTATIEADLAERHAVA